MSEIDLSRLTESQIKRLRMDKYKTYQKEYHKTDKWKAYQKAYYQRKKGE